MTEIDVIENKIKTLEKQRVEDNDRDDKAHKAILDVVNQVAIDVRGMNKKIDWLDKKYMLRREWHIVWAIAAIVFWAIWRFIWK